MRISEKVKKCVFYLGIEISDGTTQSLIYSGTGFLVSHPSRRPGLNYIYFVTAKHVQVKLEKTGHFIFRANSPQGKSIEVKINSGEIKWWFHPTDTAADIAMFTFSIDASVVDISTIPTSAFATPELMETRGIGAGDEVFVIGLFAYHKGNSKNIPIVRSGNIAMIPDERISTSDFGDMDAYLIEVWSIGGLSGSPVFAMKRVGAEEAVFYLIGFIQGHWNTSPETMIDAIEQDGKIKARENVGIAIVTPAQKILDIINCDEMKAAQKKADDSYLSENSPTPD